MRLAELPAWTPYAERLEFVLALEAVWALLLLALVAGFWRLLDRRPWPDLGLQIGNVRQWALGLALGALPGVLVFGLDLAMGHIRIEGLAEPLPGACLYRALLFALLSLAIGLTEELPFRGYLLPVLASRFGRAIPLLLTAALFLVFHLGDPDYHSPANMAQVLLMAVVLSWLRFATGGLLVPILVHAAWDACYFMLVRGPDMPGLLRLRLGPPNPWFGDFHTAGWLDLVVMVAWAYGVWRWIYRPWAAHGAEHTKT